MTTIDGLALLIWAALVLVPIFGEVSFFGVSLKQRLRDLTEHVSGLQNEIRNSVDVRASINPVFHIPIAPPDSQLPVIEQRLKGVLRDVLRDYGVEKLEAREPLPELSSDVTYLFAARYQIERELRRIWGQRMPTVEGRRPLPAFQITRGLTSAEILDPRVANAIREIYAVASPAVHGEEISDAKVAFVREVAPGIIAALRAIS